MTDSFLEVTEQRGAIKKLLGPGTIESITPNSAGSHIMLSSGRSLVVLETVDELKKLLPVSAVKNAKNVPVDEGLTQLDMFEQDPTQVPGGPNDKATAGPADPTKPEKTHATSVPPDGSKKAESEEDEKKNAEHAGKQVQPGPTKTK